METISVPINAVRVCNAISRIGYEPHSALMDIVDNSVAAGSKNINIIVEIVEGKTINQRNNVKRYIIVDDGCGMDSDGIINAFKLGSDDNYKPNSLSKYGMGLKSAGFSLGTCIKIVSKKDGCLSKKFFVDRKFIEQQNDFVVCCDDIAANEIEEYQDLLSKNNSGTVVEINGCNEVHHASAKSTIEKLKIRLGVTYFPFLSAPADKRINILLKYPGEDAYIVRPHDILYSQDAEAGFDPTSYKGATPCYAFKSEWGLPGLDGNDVAPVKLEVVTFPKGAMGGAGSPLSDEERARINSYKISRENKGFFVYRNGRLIRWGDDLGGIVNKDLIGFRARIELTTDHDDILHVDVSKQRLEMDDETRLNLDNLMRLPRKQAVNIFKICDDLLSRGTGEGVGFTETADSIPEEDPVEQINRPDPVVKKQRAKKKEEESRDVVNKFSEDAASTGKCAANPDEEAFMRVRYSDALHKMHLWSAQKDAIQGTYVIINRRHAFYQSIMSNFNESSPERLALEAIIHCCAIGENMTYENLTDVDDCNIQKVFERFYTVLSYNIGEWANGNHNIFDK